MRIIMFTGSPASHILPLHPLMEYLISRDHIIYCMGVISNKKQIEKMGAIFLEYPFDITEVLYYEDYHRMLRKSQELYTKKRYEQAMYAYLKADVVSLLNATEDRIQNICDILCHLKIDLIFRDAVDRYGKEISRKMAIPLIGYITHNLYSKNILDANPEENYYALLDFYNKGELRSDYINDIYEIEKKIHLEVFSKYSIARFDILNQYDPNTDFTIIFSTQYLQPNLELLPCKSLIFYPKLSRFDVEKSVDPKIKNIFQNNEFVIYISSGFFMQQPFSYYTQIIERLSIKGVGLVISAPNMVEKITEFINSKCYDEKNIYTSENVPQQFVLKNASLVISAGGQNTLIESIYHETPILVTPMTSEQRLNALTIEKTGIGHGWWIGKKERKTFGEMIEHLLKSEEVRKKIKTLSMDIKNSSTEFEKLDVYINNLVTKLR